MRGKNQVRKNDRFSYAHLLCDIIRNCDLEGGVRAHDLKLQSLRDRPTIKKGRWGIKADGSLMTREEYEQSLSRLASSLPYRLFPPNDVRFVLTGTDGKKIDLMSLFEGKKGKEALLTFPSSLPSPFPENNTVRAHLTVSGREKAVVIFPNLRAQEGSFSSLARLLGKFGYTTIEMVYPYHGSRYSPYDTEMVPGERLFCADMHETLTSFCMCISDILGCLLFLMKEGFTKIGAIGTSIGSTFTVLTLSHAPSYYQYLRDTAPEIVSRVPETILTAAVLNLSGGYLRDFITDPDNIEASFIRNGLVDDLGLTGEEIERLWPVADPMQFASEITIPILSVKAKQDPVLLYRYSKHQRDFFNRNTVGGKNFREFYLPIPCGHYSAVYFLPKMFVGVSDLLFILKEI